MLAVCRVQRAGRTTGRRVAASFGRSRVVAAGRSDRRDVGMRFLQNGRMPPRVAPSRWHAVCCRIDPRRGVVARKEAHMRRIGRRLATIATLAFAVGVAGAEDRGTGTSGLPNRSPSGPAATSSPGTSGTGAVEGSASSTKSCPHLMTGTVTKLDKARGSLQIDVAGADQLELELSPEELAGFEQGDQVVVSMGVHETGHNSPRTRWPPACNPEGAAPSVFHRRCDHRPMAQTRPRRQTACNVAHAGSRSGRHGGLGRASVDLPPRGR